MNTATPLIFLDPYPRTQEMVYPPDTARLLEGMGKVVSHFGSRAPDSLIECILPEVNIIVGQTALPVARLDIAINLKAILNVKGNWEPNIDYAAAQARGIYVLSAAPAMAPAVAEACIGNAIALSRKTLKSDALFRSGKESYGIKGNQHAYSLYNASVGFIGFGNLAHALLPLLKPFECAISAYDPWLSSHYLKSQGVSSARLETVLQTSRFLFILAGVTSQNEGFLNHSLLAQIQHDASVVLASRAEVLDFNAFTSLAQAGHFRAAIDVYPQEPVPQDAAFRQYDNILYSAHLAGGLWPSYQRIRSMMLDDIGQILNGHPPMSMQRAEPRQAALMSSR